MFSILLLLLGCWGSDYEAGKIIKKREECKVKCDAMPDPNIYEQNEIEEVSKCSPIDTDCIYIPKSERKRSKAEAKAECYIKCEERYR